MISMLKYEFQKMLKHKIFLVLAIAMIIGNLCLIFLHEKDMAVYSYVYEQKSQYEQYLVSKETEAENKNIEYAYYEWIDEQEKLYVDSYPAFLDEMENRATDMEKLNMYSDKNSFVYRNIQKTCKDFKDLEGTVVEVGNSYGVKQFTNYNWSIAFTILFLILSGYFLFFYERNLGLFLLLKGTKNGHMKLAIAKWSVLSVFTILYEVMKEVSTIFLMGYLYGYGDLNRNLQSISEFRNCPYEITVGGMLVLTVFIRIFMAFIMANFLFLLCVTIRSELLALGIAGLFFGLEIWLSNSILASSRFAILKCVNIFFGWDVKQVLGNYINLNIFEYAVGKNICSIVMAIFFSVVSIVLGVWLFHILCQIRSESFFEKVRMWIRRKFGFIWKHTMLEVFEIYKVFVQQKKGIWILILLFLCINSIQSANETKIYFTASDATYHNCMDNIEGKVSEESLQYVDKELAHLDELYMKLEAISKDNSSSANIMRTHLMNEIELKEEGLQIVVMQIENLKNKEGNFYDKFLVDELSYIDLWYDEQTDLVGFALGAIAISLWCSGIYPSEDKKKIFPLLRTTQNGQKKLNRSKNLCAFVGTVSVAILVQLSQLMEYYYIDGFKVIGQRLSDFTMVNLDSNLTIGGFLLLVFVLKFILFFAIMVVTVALSRLLRSEMITNIVVIGIVLLLFILLYYLKTDISQILLNQMVVYGKV